MAFESHASYKGHGASQHDERGVFTALAREDSMDLVNDPRFFHGNVINKRLAAFNKLTVVSSLMLGTSMGQLFKLKKNMNFDEFVDGWLPMGWIQFTGLLINGVVAFSCLTSVYIMAHQIFYTYRLLTAGPTGFEQASMFYLNRTVCVWRHFAIKCLFNSLWLFIIATGFLVFVTFYKDAAAKNKGPMHILIMNDAVTELREPHVDKLSIAVHMAAGTVVLAIFLCFGCFLIWIRRAHSMAFQRHYHYAQTISMPLMNQTRGMSSRAGLGIDT